MTKVRSNGIEIAYEDHGKPGDPVLLMVQGLGMPLTAWPPVLIEGLVAEGFRVVTFDNRDIGRSQLLRELKVPNVLWQTLRRKVGLKIKAPYQLTDMMRDTVGLLDALSIESAHVVGVSMGGMISQLLAIHEPRRIKSLTSVMSSTSKRKLPGPAKAVTRHVMRGPKGQTDEDRLAYHWKLWRLIGSPGYRLSDEELSEFLRRIFARGMTAAGTARQTLAILAAPSRVAELRRLAVPTLVIHGNADPLIPVECGFDTASAIPGSRITTIEGMGHDLPMALTERLVGLITQHAKATQAMAAA
jgi:pimeloyl-ACP methyl ester carboxylesterase